METIRNSVGRMLSCFTNTKSNRGGGGGFGGNNQNVFVQWNPENPEATFSGYRHLQKELTKCISDCKRCLDSETFDAMAVAFDEIRGQVYPQNLSSGQSFSPGTMALLTLAAKKIPIETEIDADTLADIQSQIDELVLSVQQVESVEVRSELEKIVSIASDALNHYAMHGAEGLSDAVYSIVGKMYKIYQTGATQKAPQDAAWSDAKSVLQKMDHAASAALKVKALGEFGLKVWEKILG